METKRTENQQKAAQLFGELLQWAGKAKRIARRVVEISNLLSMAASNGLAVTVTAEGDSPTGAGRSILIVGRNGYAVCLFVNIFTHGHRSMRSQGSVSYGTGGTWAKFGTVAEAIQKMQGIVDTHRLR